MTEQPSSSSFPRALPPSRLGKNLSSLEEFTAATNADATPRPIKEYSLIVVTTTSNDNTKNKQILLGMKHRGFGKGMYNSFGGKREPQETIEQCACRELEEETGIAGIDTAKMAQCRVGSMHYTFEDQTTKMLVHVFHVPVNYLAEPKHNHDSKDTTNTSTNAVVTIDPNCIRGCEEITPQWFSYPQEIPLDNMFADDSLWLPPLLSAFFDNNHNSLQIDGWFHFLPGGQQVNSIRHYFMTIRNKQTPPKFSLEKRLFHALCCDRMHNTTVKEFKESWAFINSVRSVFGNKYPFDVVIDVAGGHGALAALWLILTPATRAVVIDPANVGKGAVETAWRRDFLTDKRLDYRHEDLRTGLPSELNHVLQQQQVDPQRVLVVACHACQHLSEEVLQIVLCQFPGVHVAVMPCCQKDTSTSNCWKQASKNLNTKFETVMDLLLAGKAMSWQVGASYDVRLKTIDRNITPQNRVIVAKAITSKVENTGAERAAAHEKLASIYARAHGAPRKGRQSNTKPQEGSSSWLSLDRPQPIVGLLGVALGFACGFWVATVGNQRRR
ncbi:dihydro-8-oxoguanine triphosphatase [Seminavis robusta]|uniref:Dihydro-8-oxoguanine triphosphatase n=1 Tax=Seminavis robusta TaxID=568900 RepID=A0A9N8F0L5_9STRA|nr:dihydro-8-oxoguanine triphosphatase [Seminavis robusta]|eukprot:Sro2426_g327310.1 dihydro-8-oxoguanine triphosphatase (555) ;mRNA; f:9289-10953